MASLFNSWSLGIFLMTFTWAIMGMTGEAAGYYASVFRPSQWALGNATFYGDETASETMVDLWGELVGMEICSKTATEQTQLLLFNNGYACGTCYQIKCVQSPYCFQGVSFTTVTATNLCPPNWAKDSNNGGWCNPPRSHFDMSKPSFMKIANWKAGIIPVMYRRVPCISTGGLRFSFQGNAYWLLVYVMNVGGGGDIANMWVKGSRTGWINKSHNWGASYQAFATLGGQALSFKLTSYSTKETIFAWNVAPSNWNVGLTYWSNVNFH